MKIAKAIWNMFGWFCFTLVFANKFFHNLVHWRETWRDTLGGIFLLVIIAILWLIWDALFNPPPISNQNHNDYSTPV